MIRGRLWSAVKLTACGGQTDVGNKGSKAQGQDGKSYVLARKLVNKTTGAQVDLRNVEGEPAWTVRNTGGTPMDGNPVGGMRNQGGGIMQSGGGGGMMRR